MRTFAEKRTMLFSFFTEDLDFSSVHLDPYAKWPLSNLGLNKVVLEKKTGCGTR